MNCCCLEEEGSFTKGESDVNSSMKFWGVAKQSDVLVDKFFVLVYLVCLTGCMIGHQLVYAHLVGFFH